MAKDPHVPTMAKKTSMAFGTSVADLSGSGTDDESPRPGGNRGYARSASSKQNGPTEETLLLQLQLTQTRQEMVAKQNAKLLEDLAEVSKNLESERTREADLDMRLKAARHDDMKAKAAAQNMQRNLVFKDRQDVQTGAEATQQICELNEVHRRMTQVHGQLGYAVEAQKKELETCKEKVTARTRRCRRLEDALYRIIAEAQLRSELRPAVEQGIQKCGPLVHAVLKRGAERLALRELGSPAPPPDPGQRTDS